jgi:uncharacterized short protein YbdD (DUF466 family)
VLIAAGFQASDRWVITKSLRPKEILEVYLEREWAVNEKQAQKLIFDSMLTIIPGFDNYVRDFKIMNPAEVVMVHFLEKGTFTRYTIKQARKNVPLGQYKPVKIVTADKSNIIEELKECSKNA